MVCGVSFSTLQEEKIIIIKRKKMEFGHSGVGKRSFPSTTLSSGKHYIGLIFKQKQSLSEGKRKAMHYSLATSTGQDEAEETHFFPLARGVPRWEF